MFKLVSINAVFLAVGRRPETNGGLPNVGDGYTGSRPLFTAVIRKITSMNKEIPSMNHH